MCPKGENPPGSPCSTGDERKPSKTERPLTAFGTGKNEMWIGKKAQKGAATLATHFL